MKKFSRMLVLGLALAAAATTGAATTAEAAAKKKVTVKNNVTVSGKGSIKLAKGKTAKLTPSNNFKAKSYTYKTSNKKVATVSKGKIKAKKKGTANITVTAKKGKVKASAKVKVTVVNDAVKKITVAKTKTLTVGKSFTIKPKLTLTKKNSKSVNKTLKYTSSKKSIATVSSKGKVTAKKAGTATITVKATDGSNKSAKCKITVKQVVTPQPQPQPQPKTTVAPVNGKDVTATVVFGDTKSIKDDVANIQKMGKADVTVTAKMNGKTKTITLKKNGTLTDAQVNELANSKVEVTAKIDSSKIAALTAFAPKSVKSVTIGKVTFTDITATTFKIGTVAYTYTVSGTSIVVDGNVQTALSGLGDVVTITVK